MKKRMYVLYDTVAEESSPIYFAKNDKTALRNARESVKKLPYDTMADYILCYLGTFNPVDLVIDQDDLVRIEIFTELEKKQLLAAEQEQQKLFSEEKK